MIKTRINFRCVESKQRRLAWRFLWAKLYTDDLEETIEINESVTKRAGTLPGLIVSWVDRRAECQGGWWAAQNDTMMSRRTND